MFCQKCGNELNEGAVFCPKCGFKVGGENKSDNSQTSFCSEVVEKSAISLNDSTVKINRNSKKKNFKLFIIIAVCILVLIVMVKACSSCGSSSQTAPSPSQEQRPQTDEEGLISEQGGADSPEWLERNRGRGASSPQELARIFIETLDMHLVSTLDKYWDAEQDIIGTPMNDYFKTHYYEWESELDEHFNMDTVTFEGSDNPDMNKPSNFAMKIDVTGESGTLYSFVLTMHQNSTPDGERWFLAPEDHSRDPNLIDQ